MLYESPKVLASSPAMKAIQSFVKGTPLFYDMLADPRPSNCAYEADE
jgi:hypothetical protein